MTLRVWMQLASLFLCGWAVGYSVAAYNHWKDKRRHQLQVDHLRTKLRARS